MVNARSKGAGGEREFCQWLQLTLKLDHTPKRNLEQVRSGGADVIDLYPFIFEVKRCQGLSLRDWWVQVVTSKQNEKDIPVVAFRQNNQPWRFLISATNIGLDKGFVQLEELEFKKWLLLHYL